MLVGFSAESENLIENSKMKLKNKYCDLIIANDISRKDSGFNIDYNKISIIDKKGKIVSIPKNKKSFISNILAKKIVDEFLVDGEIIN